MESTIVEKEKIDDEYDPELVDKFIVKESLSDKDFETLVESYFENKVSYEALIRSYPDYKKSMLRRIVSYILNLFPL